MFSATVKMLTLTILIAKYTFIYYNGGIEK